jgi:hypothetical protein
MLKLWLLLGAAPGAPDDILPPPNSGGGMDLKDILLIGGLVLLMAFMLFLWVYLTRKNKRPQYTEGGARVIYRADEEEAARSGKHRRRRKRLPNHPDNLPRNPTLAEAGGLPPVRPDDPSESPR